MNTVVEPVKSHRPIVFVDVETTGLSAHDGHVLEIGAVRIEKGKVVARMNRLIDPGVEVPWYITKITGINNDEVKNAPQFSALIDDFDRIMEGAIFAAHNVDFDYSFISEEYKRLGQKLRLDRFCTAELSRKLHPQFSRHSLDAIINRGGYQVKNRHRAYDDALVLRKFFQALIAEYGYSLFKYVEQLLIKTSSLKKMPPPRYVPFFE